MISYTEEHWTERDDDRVEWRKEEGVYQGVDLNWEWLLYIIAVDEQICRRKSPNAKIACFKIYIYILLWSNPLRNGRLQQPNESFLHPQAIFSKLESSQFNMCWEGNTTDAWSMQDAEETNIPVIHVISINFSK